MDAAAGPGGAGEAARVTDVATSPAPGAARILMVDDQPANLRLLHRILSREGYTGLISTSDPCQVLPLFHAEQPDLVLLDLHMPEMDGFELLSRLREASPPDHVLPILVLTGDTSTESRQRALACGASDFVTKPFDTVEVALRIRNLLRIRFLHERLREQNENLEERVRQRTRELENALRRAEAAREAKSQFLAKMSHELRTPLNPIRGALSLLQQTVAGEPEARLVRMASENTDRMVVLINDILLLQSVEQGAVPLSPAPVDLAPLLRQLAQDAERRAGSDRVTVRVVAPASLPHVVLDAERLADVVARLLHNAVRFTPAGVVTLRVMTRATGGEPYMIEVEDPGVGVPLDRQEAIFEPFEQADNSNTRSYEGAGIGLAICRALCELMGMELSMESEPGRGSVFRVRLPAP